MDNVKEALNLAIQISKMDISQLLMVRKSTNNPKFHAIIDKAIDSKLPRNNPNK